jgi:hypothetical protein
MKIINNSHKLMKNIKNQPFAKIQFKNACNPPFAGTPRGGSFRAKSAQSGSTKGLFKVAHAFSASEWKKCATFWAQFLGPECAHQRDLVATAPLFIHVRAHQHVFGSQL